MLGPHIAKSYDEELTQLKTKITKMGQLAGSQLKAALEALTRRDWQSAEKVVKQDAEVDDLEKDINLLTVRLLAIRQPVAGDLRNIIAALKIATDLERVADYSVNVARHIKDLNHISLERAIPAIAQMGEVVQEMVEEILEAYMSADSKKAVSVWNRDQEVDEIYASALTRLRHSMKDDPKSIRACTSLLFVARCLERIGDHIQNVSEHIYFMVHGVAYHGKQ